MNNDNGKAITQCGCWLVIFLINFFLGGWSVNWLLDFFLNKAIPFFWAGVIGMVVGELSIPIAVVLSILHYFNVM